MTVREPPVKVGLCDECRGARKDRCWVVEFRSGYVAHEDRDMAAYYLRLMYEAAGVEVPS